ncbi:MAG: Mth938-like domain-containing protein [Cocleimonas sp.]
MKFAEDNNSARYKITGYESDGVEINGLMHKQAFILSPMELINDWQPQNLSALSVEHFDALYTLKPEVIILGTGEKQIFPDREILKFLVQNRIGYEIMDTPAACRTFNIIMAEGRNVVAGMFLL